MTSSLAALAAGLASGVMLATSVTSPVAMFIGLAAGIMLSALFVWPDRAWARSQARRRTAAQIRNAISEYIDHQCPDGVVRHGHPRYALRRAAPAFTRICDWYGKVDNKPLPGLFAEVVRTYGGPDATTRDDRAADTHRIAVGSYPVPLHTPTANRDGTDTLAAAPGGGAAASVIKVRPWSGLNERFFSHSAARHLANNRT